jgi:hypothetical protein
MHYRSVLYGSLVCVIFARMHSLLSGGYLDWNKGCEHLRDHVSYLETIVLVRIDSSRSHMTNHISSEIHWIHFRYYHL